MRSDKIQLEPKIVCCCSLLTDFNSFKSQYISTFPVIAFSLRIGAKLSMAIFNSLTCPSKLIKSSQLNFDNFTWDKSCERRETRKLAIKFGLRHVRHSQRRWECSEEALRCGGARVRSSRQDVEGSSEMHLRAGWSSSSWWAASWTRWSSTKALLD